MEGSKPAHAGFESPPSARIDQMTGDLLLQAALCCIWQRKATDMGEFLDKVLKEIGGSDRNQDVSDWLSTGYLPLDYAVSGKYKGGGLPMGRIIEVYGPESSGKTLVATMAMIETQRRGGFGVFLDYEHAFSTRRAVQLGLSTDDKLWLYKQPETAEEGFALTEKLCEAARKDDAQKPFTIVNDSVASMVTQEELETGIGDENMKTRLSLASCMSTNLKKIASAISRSNVTLIFLNQVRSNPGVMFGNKETTPGGGALRFYASVRIRLHKEGKVKDSDSGPVIGEKVKAQIVKNKVFDAFREAAYMSTFAEGINLHRSHIDALKEAGLLGNTKGWLEMNGQKYRANDLEALCRKDSAIYSELLGLFDGSHGASI